MLETKNDVDERIRLFNDLREENWLILSWLPREIDHIRPTDIKRIQQEASSLVERLIIEWADENPVRQIPKVKRNINEVNWFFDRLRDDGWLVLSWQPERFVNISGENFRRIQDNIIIFVEESIKEASEKELMYERP